MVLRDSEDSVRTYSKGMSIPSLELASPTSFDAPEIDGHPMILWSAESVEHGCGIGQCVIAYNITPPYLWKTPLYIKDGESESYNIVANHLKNYSRFVCRQSGPQDFPVESRQCCIAIVDGAPNHVGSGWSISPVSSSETASDEVPRRRVFI
ncbi:hypothetical protein [Shewanella sp. 4t3-1-2LB]|uniref:hypothetical protein n=1 Tax=Shewanella sp. 4t3-1-2LB TaxID=2817682 RepID=UPI001F60A4FB|nr:hypothetical protein [Shewanella sp. 4t3-1-2LB]